MSRFRTRARAVDMLGRQQIAGIPNAISELFKNAHDAYADYVVVDYFRPDNLFVLRDDGFGMTREEFEARWLTLGTEHKLLSEETKVPPNKKKRPIMGEKGIGRLAIAAIGPQVLVLTRAKRNGKLHNVVAAFIHWGVFEIPGVDLENIEIPVHVMKNEKLPDDTDVQQLIKVVRSNIENLNNFIGVELKKKLTDDLSRFDVNPTELSELLGEPSLLDNKNGGTHFYILPASENLATDIDLDIKDEKVSDLRKLLLGFSNTMLPKSAPSPIKTAFRNWTTYGQCTDLIGERQFFTPQEFEVADHHIHGDFDEFGQFRGVVRVYDEEPIDHVISWPRSLGKPTSCGPFRINFAFIQGAQRDSKMSPEQYADIKAKLERIGGLYIYRDGIRILPYGDTKFDFLEIEERRSKSAGYYYFSYRNMFGAIEITRSKNEKLVEKAGREGFQENRAYREFKEILINFFIQIAADFFRRGGEHTSVYERRKDEYDRIERARREQEKKSSASRRLLADKLETFFSRIHSKETKERITHIQDNLSESIERICTEKDANEGPDQVLIAETRALRSLEELRESIQIKRPSGVGLTKQLKRDWQAYLTEIDRLDKVLFKPSENQIKRTAAKAIKDSNFRVDRKHYINRVLQEITKLKREELKREIENTNKVLKDTDFRILNLFQEMSRDIDTISERTMSDFEQLDKARESVEELDIFVQNTENRLNSILQDYLEILDHLQSQLPNINWLRDEEGTLFGEADMKAALEDEVLALREQTEADLELTQLGMAIEIINHEFNNTVKSIRTSLRKLKTWADLNPELKGLYRNLRVDFDHLDGYLNLFTPLHRRLYRKVTTISGADIANYLKDLFGERMERHRIQLMSTKTFRNRKIEGYPSTFYPVFVNLVDNSIYWLKDRPLPRKIELNANEEAFVVTDTGPGILERDYEAVFELGFTRKPGGRGLGLHISRQILRREGFELELEPYSEGKGATFRIFARNQKSNNRS